MWLRLIISCMILCMLSNSIFSQKWKHHTVLDRKGMFHLYWNPPDDKINDDEITFKVEVKTKGYFGFGFSPNGGMPGSDIVTGWIKDGEVYFQDRHADAFSLPSKDKQQDYVLIDAYENDTFTVFQFRRKLDTCDQNDWVIDESTQRVIYAYSEEDPKSNAPFYHRENRGSQSIILLQKNVEEDQELNFTSLLKWDLLSPGADFSSYDTLYWCKIFKSPEVSEKHHIVYIEHLIEEDNVEFVHHMTVYECVGGTPEQYEDLLDGRGYECYQPDTPEEMFWCQNINADWAFGGKNIMLPEHVGFPIDTTMKYYMLEVHYNNPQLLEGEPDHSGYRFHYTNDIRKYDAGYMTIGASPLPRSFIPPGQNEYVVPGHGIPECFTSLLPDSGAKALGIFLHAHLIGREIKARHFRGNRELKPIYDDKHYDFNYQAYRFFTDEVTILPNDQITVECTYNSSQRNAVTSGGASTSDEMCTVIIIYYPRVSGSLSLTGPSFATINKFLNTNVSNEYDLYDVLTTYDWKSVDIDALQNAMRYSEHEAQCYLGLFRENEEPSLISYPDDLIPYEELSNCINKI